jgi:hypothetical protein
MIVLILSIINILYNGFHSVHIHLFLNSNGKPAKELFMELVYLIRSLRELI